MYDYVIVTHIPAFYKVNLYNELAKQLNILVIFIAADTDEKRSSDFISLEDAKFTYELLSHGNFQRRDVLKNIDKLKTILKTIEYKRLLIGGWDLKEFWYLIFTNPKSKNSLALESTALESSTDGLKGFIKKLFLSRIERVFASGALHVELLKKLHFLGEIKITKGVGIINKPEFIKKEKIYQKRFLYIGRVSKVKNLVTLVRVFNDLSEHSLTIIGDGEEREYLKTIAKSNIIFTDAIENSKIKDQFLNHDIFILPSISEPWGLVSEEALYFGLPVLISKNCGSLELIEDGINGYIFDPLDIQNIKETILSIDTTRYTKLCANVEKFSIDKKDQIQLSAYL